MLYAFIIPLAGGLLPVTLLMLTGKFRLTRSVRRFIHIYDSGVATLTVGSILKGVLDIYGTTNRLIVFYAAFGSALLLLGGIGYMITYKHSAVF